MAGKGRRRNRAADDAKNKARGNRPEAAAAELVPSGVEAGKDPLFAAKAAGRLLHGAPSGFNDGAVEE